MWLEDLKDLHHPKRHGIRSYFPVMGPGTVTFGDLVVHMTQIHSIHGVRNHFDLVFVHSRHKS